MILIEVVVLFCDPEISQNLFTEQIKNLFKNIPSSGYIRTLYFKGINSCIFKNMVKMVEIGVLSRVPPTHIAREDVVLFFDWPQECGSNKGNKV